MKKILLMKALTWQLIGFITSLLISYLFTGSIFMAGEMTVAMTLAAFILYFIHERLWLRFLQTPSKDIGNMQEK